MQVPKGGRDAPSRPDVLGRDKPWCPMQSKGYRSEHPELLVADAESWHCRAYTRFSHSHRMVEDKLKRLNEKVGNLQCWTLQARELASGFEAEGLESDTLCPENGFPFL
jgi:hypothetical protein